MDRLRQIRGKIATMVAKSSHQVEGGGTQQSLMNRRVEGEGEKVPQESPVTRMMSELELLVKQPVLPAECQSESQLCQQGGGGPQLTFQCEDVAPETGFRGNFEEVGRAFVQAYKEGWRLIKEEQPKNETHQGYVQGEGAGVNHPENGLEPCEDFWWDDQGGCTDLGFRCPCQPQGGDDVENKGAKSKSKRPRRGRRRKKRSQKEDCPMDILWWTSESDGEGGEPGSEKKPGDVSGGERYQANEGEYDDGFCDKGASGGENYEINAGGYDKFYNQGVGGPNVGINSVKCASPVKSLVGVKLHSHNMFARMAPGGSCSLISKKLVTDLGFWSWVQQHRRVITNTDGQAKKVVGVIFLELEFLNSPFKEYHPFEVIDEDWGNVCVLGGDFLNEYGVNFRFYQGGGQIFSDYWGIYEPVMVSFAAPAFTSAPKSVCRYYMRGWCRFGSRCWFDHPNYLVQPSTNNFYQAERRPVYDPTYGGEGENYDRNPYPPVRADQWGVQVLSESRADLEYGYDEAYYGDQNYDEAYYGDQNYDEAYYGGQDFDDEYYRG